MEKLYQLSDLGQAIWLDFIRRSFSTTGELVKLVDQGLRGVTSNPSIFEKAIVGSDDYDPAIKEQAAMGKSVIEIYESLAIEDIQLAADILRPVYDATGGQDGYVSLEVNPALAHDTLGTLHDAERLFITLERPNVMIKIPATPEGIPAIEGAISKGININVTLIFSEKQYQDAAQAYIAGVERLIAAGGNPSQVASVASFFVSRLDTAIDMMLASLDADPALLGRSAVSIAKMSYQLYKQVFSGNRWTALETAGARVQRPLWASTSTKNPAYPDTLYVDGLIGPDTVNTLPPETLEAFLDHGKVALTLESELDQAGAHLDALARLGIDPNSVAHKLQDDGVQAFANSFNALLSGIETKRTAL